MIALDFSLFWCGGKISYLRFLTFKTLRYFHKNSKIDLYLSKNSNKTIHQWGAEQQDFEKDDNTKDYLDDIKKLDVNIIEMDYFGSPNFCPIFQTDLFRWWVMNVKGGFYLDSDQLILKSFETLPLDKDFIYSQFPNRDRVQYSPTGLLGCSRDHKIAKSMMKLVPKYYSPKSYNSSGPFVFEYALLNSDVFRESNIFNAPYDYFYPISCSSDVSKIYDGSFKISTRSFALHFYLGHPLSQDFNRNYTPELSKNNSDTISKFLREKNLL